MPRDVDDAEARHACLDFVERVHPQLQPRLFRLAQLFQRHPLRSSLPRQNWISLLSTRIKRLPPRAAGIAFVASVMVRGKNRGQGFLLGHYLNDI